MAIVDLINRSIPDDLDVHLIIDNVSAHKTPEIHRWLLRCPRFHLHFTPTYSSWMNMERWCPGLTERWLRRFTHGIHVHFAVGRYIKVAVIRASELQISYLSIVTKNRDDARSMRVACSPLTPAHAGQRFICWATNGMDPG